MLIFLRGDVPHIDDGFGEVRPLREEEAQVLALSVEALSAPDPDAEAVFSAEVQPHLVTWRRALALSAVGSQEVPLPELDAVATVLAHGDLDRAAYLGGLMAAARAWRGTLEGNVQDLAKARRWITAHPNGPGSRGIPLLIESTADGGAKIIGGAGGKLNGQKLGSLKPGAGGEAKNTREHKAEALEPRDPRAPTPAKGYPLRGRQIPSGAASPELAEKTVLQLHQSWERIKQIDKTFEGMAQTDANHKRWQESRGRAEKAAERAQNAVIDAYPKHEHGKVGAFLEDAYHENLKHDPPSADDAKVVEARLEHLSSRATPKQSASGGSGAIASGRQMPLFKARMVMTMPQRLAKSTLAPVATPAQRVTVGDTLAFWRTNDSGMGVLEIPLKSGKSLLVLASDLALALREGAAELALVLKGLAPARALISMPGRFKTARKPA